MENNCEMPTCSQIGDIQQIKTDVREIKIALLGNEFNKDGIIQRLVKTESDMKKVKGRLIYFSGMGVVAGAVFGFVLGKIF